MDRFDLEYRITKTYDFSQYLRDLADGVTEIDMKQVDIINTIKGLSVMLDLHTEKLFDTFVQVFGLDKE